MTTETTIPTWAERCESHPDHDGIVTEAMIKARMQEEIDELRGKLREAERVNAAQAKAIEFAEYLATGAEGFADSVNKLLEAMDADEFDDDAEEQADAIEQAGSVYSDHAAGLRSRIYEFRKRKDKAIAEGEK